MKSRTVIIFVLLMFVWMILIIRGGVIQFVPDERLTQLENRLFRTVVTLQGRRGAIVDRKGRELALSERVYSLYGDPQLVPKKRVLIQKLGKVLGKDPRWISKKIFASPHGKRFVWISRFLNVEKKESIQKLKIPGLAFVEEFKRIYPNEDLLKSTLGFVGVDGQGLGGLEYEYDNFLSGDKKKVSVRRDARGRPLIVDGKMLTENPEGKELRLTIDSEVQHELEKELKSTINSFQADGAYGVILEAQTSAVVALVGSITDSFEPGSTMKTFTVAGSLKSGHLNPNTRYNTEGGKLKIGNRWIHEASVRHNWKSLSVSEILAYSSNVGVTKIAFEMGAPQLRSTLDEFGFGSKTGINLPGESRGLFPPLPWNAHLLSNISFGQGLSVTPLQMANAYAVVANGGYLRKPFIVQNENGIPFTSLVSSEPEGTTIHHSSIEFPYLRRVLTDNESKTIRLMLAGVTAHGGTGVKASLENYSVAGKTGTAQKVNHKAGGYLKNGYISSFAGFFPVDHPQYVIFIAVDYPKKNSYYGSEVAAPIFSRMAQFLARNQGMAPTHRVPLRLASMGSTSSAPPAMVPSTLPSPSPSLSSLSSLSYLSPSSPPSPPYHTTSSDLQNHQDGTIEVPNLSDLTAREVLQRFQGQSLSIHFQGSGRVVQTFPPAGTLISTDGVKKSKELRVILR